MTIQPTPTWKKKALNLLLIVLRQCQLPVIRNYEAEEY
jgi:hypothetical protein